MKYTITHTAEWVLLAIITVLLVFTAYKSYKIKGKIETITVTDTIALTDTITNWEPEYVYLSHFDTIKLPVIDTVNDTIIKIDSVLVQIPISIYQYDTVISDTNYRTSLKAVLSGFGVSVDTLCLSTEIIQQQTKNSSKWYNNICPSAGVGFGTGGFGFFVGIGYKIFSIPK